MTKILIVNKTNQVIESRYDDVAPNQAKYGGPWGDPSLYEHIAVPAELDADVVGVQLDAEGAMEVVVDTAKQATKLEQQWATFRAQRDAKLAACDWTQATDSPLSAEVKTAWATYRQALRDLPEATLDPAAPNWPISPA